MKKILLLVLSLVFICSNSLFAQFVPVSDEEFESAENLKTVYVGLPILTIELKKEKIVVNEESKKIYKEKKIHLSQDTKLNEKIEAMYEKQTNRDIEVVDIEISNDGRYAYIHAVMKVLNLFAEL